MGRRRGLRWSVATCAGALAACLPATATPAATAATATGTNRVTVALFGDSVTQGLVIPDYLTEGLAPQLSRAETAYGYTPGGVGLLPADEYLWHFNRSALAGFATPPADGWALYGYESTTRTVPSLDGPSGWAATTSSPRATASITVSEPDVEVLYATTPYPDTFTVTSGSRAWTLNTWRPGASAATEAPLSLGPGRHTLTVHGPRNGLLTFTGIIAARPAPTDGTQLEIDNLGHAGRAPDTDLAPRVEQAILLRHYDLSVFLYGYIAALEASPGATADTYRQALLTRARLARTRGGRCLIVAPAPLPEPAATIRLVASLDQGVARQAGCTYTTVLTHLWRDPQAAIDQGLTVVDGIHPTPAGYARMAAALAPVVARLLSAP